MGTLMIVVMGDAQGVKLLVGMGMLMVVGMLMGMGVGMNGAVGMGMLMSMLVLMDAAGDVIVIQVHRKGSFVFFLL